MDSLPEQIFDFEEHQLKEEEALIEENEDSVLISRIFDNLHAKSEILLEIFSRFMSPAIFKLNCVSKSLSNLTRNTIFTSKYSSNITGPLTGFLYQRKFIRSCLSRKLKNDVDVDEPKFLSVKHELGCLPDPSLGFLKQDRDTNSVVKLIDSCNGLLLCMHTNLIVCNPLTKEIIVLPHTELRSDRVYYALLAGLTKTGYLQYKVVCVFMPIHGEPCTKLLVLSSETGVWEEFDEILPALCHESMMGSKVVFNGSLFWDCLESHVYENKGILICHLNVKKSQSCYELLLAPRAPLGRCLWKYQDKLLCYCHGFPDEFPAWSLCIDEGDDKNKLKWKLDGCEEFETMTEDICKKYTETWKNLKKAKPRIRFKIMAYMLVTNSIYLWIPDSIYSYELTERRFKHVWGYRVEKFKTPSMALPYLHSLAPIQIGQVQEEEHEINGEGWEGSSNTSNDMQYDWSELMQCIDSGEEEEHEINGESGEGSSNISNDMQCDWRVLMQFNDSGG